jgi:hypothetical protein
MIGECTLCFRGIRIDFVFYTAFACGVHKLLDMKRRFCYFDADFGKHMVSNCSF